MPSGATLLPDLPGRHSTNSVPHEFIPAREQEVSMSYKSATLDGLFVVRWGENPEAADVENYAAELQAAHERQGNRLVALFIMPPDSGAPSDPFRKAQAARLPEIMSHLHYAVAVFEGEGFKTSLKRSALVAILMLTPKRFPIHVRSSVREALVDKPAGPVDFDGKRALLELQRRALAAA
jgi:hypothetical protein